MSKIVSKNLIKKITIVQISHRINALKEEKNKKKKYCAYADRVVISFLYGVQNVVSPGSE